MDESVDWEDRGLGQALQETFRGTFSEPRCLKEVRREPHLAVLERFLRCSRREAQTQHAERSSDDDSFGEGQRGRARAGCGSSILHIREERCLEM
jgi:hypothetical protein